MESQRLEELREIVHGPRRSLLNMRKRSSEIKKSFIGYEDNKKYFTLNQLGLFNFSEISELRMFCKQIYKEINYAVNGVSMPSKAFIQGKKILLQQSHKKLLLLGLQGTLVHEIRMQSGEEETQSLSGDQKKIILRPHLLPFLNKVSKHYDIFVWTSSALESASKIVRHINREHEYIKGILHKDHCLETKNGVNIKDIRIIENRNEKDIVMIDNKLSSFSFHLSNGIPIQQFQGNSKDDVLRNLQKFLVEVSKSANVQTFLAQKLGLRDIVSSTSRSFTDEIVSLYV